MGRMGRAAGLVWLALSGAGACTWVDLTEPGRNVRVVPADAVAACEKLGTANVRTTDRIGPIARSERKVHEELDALGRNEAAALGGDTLVPLGPIREGRRSFEVYRCPTP